MKKRNRIYLLASAALLLAFVLWTVLVRAVDVAPIGPRDSSVGFAALNGGFHRLTGVHLWLYIVTDWLGLVPIAVAFGFAILGLVQWIGRKSLLKVDGSILLLGGFYIVVMAVYLLFEYVVINYRPILINDVLETSYPSSTTLMVLCVMLGSLVELKSRIKSTWLNKTVSVVIYAFVAFMIVGRIISGVHWISDIIGGILLSAGLVMFYSALIRKNNSR